MNFLQDETFCYILGLMWADGFVIEKKYTAQLTISSKDFKNIDEIFSKSKIKYSISHRERFLKKTGKYYKSSTIYILDKEFRKFLVENFYAEKSNSSPELILNEMPIENKKHFLRGYIDGDGSFSIYNNEKTVKFNVTSSLEQN
jgi:intein/homing endonuclease